MSPANEILKLAKSLVAGGGAGIIFTAKPDDVDIPAKYRNGKVKFGKPGKLEIDSFDAEGYMDGDTNVSGSIMKVDSIDFDQRELAKIVEEYIEDVTERWEGTSTPVTTNNVVVTLAMEELKTILWAGYVRGTMKTGDFLTLEGEAEVHVTTDDDYDTTGEIIDVTVYVKVDNRFEDWYWETFEAWMEEDEDE